MDPTGWIHAYVAAWESNDPAAIAALFTGDAVYDPQTGGPPWRGAAEIVAGWTAIADPPGTWTFTWKPLVASGDMAIITGTTRYPAKTYRNLWVMRFAGSGRCREFTEWWIEEPGAGPADR